MSSNKQIHKITIKKVINERIEEQSSSILEDELRKDLGKTEELIRRSKYSSLDEYTTRRILAQMDDRIIACEEAEIDKTILTKLKHNYYELKDIMLRQQSENLEIKLNKFNRQIEEKEKKNDAYINETKEKIDNIGFNILSIIISFTLGSTLISAVDKISSIYIPLFIIGSIWLLMTLIVFINALFNKKDFNSKQATFMYGIFSILTIIALLYTVSFSSSNKSIVPLCENNSIETINN